jgi:hypothetical protein
MATHSTPRRPRRWFGSSPRCVPGTSRPHSMLREMVKQPNQRTRRSDRRTLASQAFGLHGIRVPGNLRRLVATAPPHRRHWCICRSDLSARMVFRFEKHDRRQFPKWRLVSFLLGIAFIWLAIASPLDGFADALLSAHMVEHLLLMSFVPPLLLSPGPSFPCFAVCHADSPGISSDRSSPPEKAAATGPLARHAGRGLAWQ